ncbi:MAG: allose kinase [Clostridiales bacterium]|nr:allose kinase [Clostridiales bacterium]
MAPSPYMIGIDIGGTHVRIGAVDESGEILGHRILSSRQYLSMSNPADALVRDIAAFRRDTPGEPRGVCIGIPGVIGGDRSTVLSVPNLPVLDGVNLRAALEQGVCAPALVVHEVLLLLTNDMRAQNLRNLDIVMAVYLGTGIGNAMYIHGRLLEGKNGVSGELGHLPIPWDNAPCPCGNVGCVELYASGKRLEAIREQYYPEAKDFAAMFAAPERHPEIDRYLDCVACTVAAEVNILDPDCVLLGGGVLSIANYPYEELLGLIRKHTRKPYPADTLRVVRLPEDPLRGVRGAGLYGWEHAG